jgi:hypothetical protein
MKGNPMTKIEEIYETVLPEMAYRGIEDTLANRFSFLAGMQEAWLEDPEWNAAKAAYCIAVHTEIVRLNLELTAQGK